MIFLVIILWLDRPLLNDWSISGVPGYVIFLESFLLRFLSILFGSVLFNELVHLFAELGIIVILPFHVKHLIHEVHSGSSDTLGILLKFRACIPLGVEILMLQGVFGGICEQTQQEHNEAS